ncbi:MAG: glycine cleavage system aminomethyltransferase GcvT [Spirochaetes bacterium]|nr:glycine cleavage system aminomethyltransferase GcvT [Spirochaetota bacterium]
MKSTPLEAEHKNLGAKFTEFAGYNMPVSYGAVKDEVTAVRSACGMFDVSHMLPISLKATSREKLVQALNRICVRATDKLKSGKAQYNAFYNEHAGLVDDITISALSDTHWLIVANAGNRDADVAHLQKHTADLIEIQPWADYTLIAIQGPKAQVFLQKKFSFLDDLYYYEAKLANEKTFVARMGYTGEDGFEIAMPANEGIALWRELTAAGVTPCGLAARDVLRLEALMPLYGHELATTLRPQESGIAFIYNDHECIAPRALREAPVANITCGFRMVAEGVPRQGYAIVAGDGNRVGEVTSGTFSFTQNYGMGMMRISSATKAQELYVEIRQEKKPIEILEKAPIRSGARKRPKA